MPKEHPLFCRCFFLLILFLSLKIHQQVNRLKEAGSWGAVQCFCGFVKLFRDGSVTILTEWQLFWMRFFNDTFWIFEICKLIFDLEHIAPLDPIPII